MVSGVRVKHLLIFTIAAYAVLKTTTLGWYFLAPRYHGRSAGKTSDEKLRAAVTALASDIGPRDLFNNNKARLRRSETYVAGRLRAAGYKVRFQEYMAAGVKVRNIIAAKRGVSLPDEKIVLGAHYDTFNNPGADDNASGVAGLLELADYAAGKEFSRTVEFAAFVNEEPPFFKKDTMGSAVYTAAAAASGERIAAAIVLEMIGFYTDARASQRYPPLVGPFFPSRGNFIAQVADLRSARLAARISGVFGKASTLPLRTAVLPAFVPGADYSDHRSFWAHGYHAVMFTDTAFYRNANYHSASDKPDTLNYEYMAALLDGLKAALDDLAGAK